MLKDRIAHIMRAKNLSATQLADQLEVQRSGISHLLSGRNKPSLDFVMKLKENFPEFNLDWLILGEGPMTVSSPRSTEKRPQQALFEQEIQQTASGTMMEGDAFSLAEESKEAITSAKNATNATKKAPLNEQGALLSELDADIQKIILVYADQSFEVLTPRQSKIAQTD